MSAVGGQVVDLVVSRWFKQLRDGEMDSGGPSSCF